MDVKNNMGWENLRTQKHMEKQEFDKFLEVYKLSLELSNIVPCSEAVELELRSLATYMWDAGRNWSDTHNQ